MARPANSYRNRAAARAKAYQSVQVVNTKTDTPVPESTGGISTRNIITNSVGLGEGIGVGLGGKLGRGNLSRVNKPNTETEGAKAADKTGTDVKELTSEQIAARERDTALTDERTHRVSEASQQLLDYQAWLNSPEGKAAEERRQTRKHGSENMNDASAVININWFKAQPNRGSGKRRERTSWVEIQDALDNKIMPNELYIQGDKGFVSTAYNITLFMLPEGK
ncbi:uncharacterized protein METZ01_LOCUS358554, partial [marine metagenome]